MKKMIKMVEKLLKAMRDNMNSNSSMFMPTGMIPQA